MLCILCFSSAAGGISDFSVGIVNGRTARCDLLGLMFLFFPFLHSHSGSMKSDGSNPSSTASATTHNVLNNLAGFGLLDTAQEVQSPLTASVAPKVRVLLIVNWYFPCFCGFIGVSPPFLHGMVQLVLS